MISENTHHTDKDDIAVLFRAMCQFESINGEELDLFMGTVGYGEMLTRAEVAAEVIAEHHQPEFASWDGAVWLERLEDVEDDSLAGQLFQLDSDHPAYVVGVVKDWLESNGF